MASELENLDKLQRQDHDTLIRLETKVDSLLDEIKEMKEGNQKKIDDHENRINALEDWRKEIESKWKLIVTVVGTLSGIGGYLIAMLVDFLRNFGR